ncbi:MAG: hypothetical protein N2Z80_04175 [Hydrogenothermaceae bacterium]|nr:hypothetical protein [Hydrogenothermaceae bacterium]
MKKYLFTLNLYGIVGTSYAQVVENPILKKLVEKGVLTQQEEAEIDEQLAKEESEKAEYQAEMDKVIMETKEKFDKKFKLDNLPSNWKKCKERPLHSRYKVLYV